MKDFFKKLSKPQPEVEDLDTGYNSEYYAGASDKADRREDRREDDRRADRYEERDYRAERTDRFDRAERVEREADFYTPRTGLYEEEDAPAYRERVEEKVEPVFTPEPAPEYLYYTPATYRDCREGIVKGLAAGHVVVVRLGDLEASDVLRLFDYMMGAVLALDAELVRPEATTVVLVPDGVELDEDELELDDEDEYEDDEAYEDDEDEEYDEDEAYEEYDEDGEYEEDSDEDAE
ncbi:MAG: cell division protein SepF [Clostridia bacterium]|nr:cell division protein SepF [Clostridia bacterium]